MNKRSSTVEGPGRGGKFGMQRRERGGKRTFSYKKLASGKTRGYKMRTEGRAIRRSCVRYS